MNQGEQRKVSKFLSLVLRHQPQVIGLELDENGWAEVELLLEKMVKMGFKLSGEELEQVVDNNDKKRFSFSEDLRRIRANQGHSVKVELGLIEKIPLEILYHGTARINLESIKEKGLLKGQRHHVHLSLNRTTARQVGMRYGKPVVLEIQAGLMQKEGGKFYESENGVWLTEAVSPEFINIPEEKDQEL